MKLRLSLLLFCLFGIGIFSDAQDKKPKDKRVIENGDDAIPVTVTSKKKAHLKKPPPAPPIIGKDGKPLPPPKVDVTRFPPPRPVKDAEKIPPPPPPKPKAPEKSEEPSAAPEVNDLYIQFKLISNEVKTSFAGD